MIYSIFINSNTLLSITRHFMKHAILMTRNDIIDKLNEQLFAFMNDKVFTSYNINKMIDDENAEIYIIEYLNIINLSNLSLHELKLKIGIFIVLLYNLNSSIELCNETCLHIIHIDQRVIECEILGDKYIDNMIIISRISLLSSSIVNLSFEFR